MALYDPRLLTRSIWRQIARFARRQMERAGWKLEEDGVVAQDYRRFPAKFDLHLLNVHD